MATKTQSYNQQLQKIQFYKIKLMEKEREISEFTTKIKKIDFKNNRDLKQLKMAQQKAKNQLKDQKNKLQKMTKTALEATEQNKILQHRMNQIKEDKDKQIQSIRNQYNHLKIQVRSYERILPTLTFLNQLGAKIDQLPTYQQIFSNLKERVERCDNLQVKLKTTKQQMQQKIQIHLKIEESLKKNKIDLQKGQRDHLTKMFQLESQISALHVELQEIRQKSEQMQNQYHDALDQLEQLTQTKKSLQEQLQQFKLSYHTEMQAKEQQIKKLSQQYFQNHETQIQELRQNFQIKQHARLQQLIQFEQDERIMQQKIQKDKQRYQQGIRQYQIFLQNVKQQTQIQRTQKQKLANIIQQLNQNINLLNQQKISDLRVIAQKQMRIQQLQKVIQENNDNVQDNMQKVTGITEQAENTRKQLEDTIAELEQQNQYLQQQIREHQKQILVLNNQLEQFRNRALRQNRSSFPATSLYYQNQISRMQNQGSIQSSKDQGQEMKQEISQLKIDHIVPKNILLKTDRSHKSRRCSVSSNSMRIQQQFTTKIKQQRLKMQQQYSLKIQLINSQKIQAENINKSLKHQLLEIQKSLKLKIKKLEQQLASQKQNSITEANKLKKKYEIIKNQLQQIDQANSKLLGEIKKQNQIVNSMKITHKQIEREIKQIKKQNQNLHKQIETLKKNKQKLELKQQALREKQKDKNAQAGYKQLLSKYTAQITKITQEKQQLISEKQEKEKEIQRLQNVIFEYKEKMSELETQASRSNKEIDMINQQLEHQRKDRTLRTVPSLALLDYDLEQQQEQNYKQYYNQAPQKEVQIVLLQKQVQNLKQEVDDLKQTYENKIYSIQEESNQYIQQIIKMKVVVAEAQMKANEKVHLYNQIKRRFIPNQNVK